MGFASFIRSQIHQFQSKQSNSNMSTILLICRAIKAIAQWQKGASRQAIAAYLVANNGKTANAAFNANLRRALKAGLESGVLAQGASAQRFKYGAGAKALMAPPKPIKKKTKKKVVKKKKVTKKKAKKKTVKKIKKPVKKTTKKKTNKKKKTTKKRKN